MSATHPEPNPDGENQPPELYYGSTDEFVREYLRHVYKRRIDGMHSYWSAQWWRSAEAVARLEALWRAWEHLRLDPTTGPSVWWRDHADPHMAVLLSSEGPFGKEASTKASVLDPLPYEQPPEGLFPDVRTRPTQPEPAPQERPLSTGNDGVARPVAERSFVRADMYVTAPAGGRECARCGAPIAGGAPAVSVAGLYARGLAHPDCLPQPATPTDARL